MAKKIKKTLCFSGIILAAMVAATIVAAIMFAACPVPENEIVREPVSGLEILRNQTAIGLSDNGKPEFEITEEKTVILSAKLEPAGVKGGIQWQSSRDIVELNKFTGEEITLFARYGGDTTINVRGENAYNEVPVHGQVRVTVVPISYFKWDYQQDGWNELSALRTNRIGFFNMLVRSGDTTIAEDAEFGGMILESPSVFVIGSVMASSTSSVYDEDPLYDENALLNFTESPSKRPELYNGRIRISVDYEVLVEPARRQGLRIQVNNNSTDRDNASVINNWLVAEYTAASPHSGTLSGVFNANEADFDPFAESSPKFESIGGVVDRDAKLQAVLSKSFVCLAVPDGKVLIRSIRIESAD